MAPPDLNPQASNPYLSLLLHFTARAQWMVVAGLVLGGVVFSYVFVWHVGYDRALKARAEAHLRLACTNDFSLAEESCDVYQLALVATAVQIANPAVDKDGTIGLKIADMSAPKRTELRKQSILYLDAVGRGLEVRSSAVPVLGIEATPVDTIPILSVFIVLLLASVLGTVDHIRILVADFIKHLTPDQLQRAATTGRSPGFQEEAVALYRGLPAHFFMFWPAPGLVGWIKSLVFAFPVIALLAVLASDVFDIFGLRQIGPGWEASVSKDLTPLWDAGGKTQDAAWRFTLGLIIRESFLLTMFVFAWVLFWQARRRLSDIVSMIALLRWREEFRDAIQHIIENEHKSNYGQLDRGGNSGDSPLSRPKPKAPLDDSGEVEAEYRPVGKSQDGPWSLKLNMAFSVESSPVRLKADLGNVNLADSLPSLLADSSTVSDHFRKMCESNENLKAAILATFGSSQRS